MKKNKMSLTTELDLTREGTAEMTRWCILIALHQSFGAGRLNRLKEEALANYRQVNEEGHADGLDVAMEHLRRCAQDALKEEVTVDEQPDEDRVRQSERDYEEQKRAFLKRAVMQQLGRRAGKGGLRILSEKKLEEKAAAAMAELKEHTWGKRISTP